MGQDSLPDHIGLHTPDSGLVVHLLSGCSLAEDHESPMVVGDVQIGPPDGASRVRDCSAMKESTSLGRMLWRALGRRCPHCGNRQAWFEGWFRQGSRCVGCGIRRTRNVEGHELGSLTVGLVVNIGLISVALGLAIALTVPDVPVLTLYVVLAVTALIVPIVTWPLTHTVWMAIDLRSRPLDSDELREAAAWLAQTETSVRSDNA